MINRPIALRLNTPIMLGGSATKEVHPGRTCRSLERALTGYIATFNDGRIVEIPWGSIAYVEHEQEPEVAAAEVTVLPKTKKRSNAA